MPENESSRYDIEIEIFQKFFISLIFYLFYNTNIVDLYKKKDYLASIYINKSGPMN